MKLVIVISIFTFWRTQLSAQTDSVHFTPDSLTKTALIDTLLQVIARDSIILIKKEPNSDQVNEIISYAKKFLGTPYHYAGTTPSGFDCSGFIYYVMGNFGVGVTRTSYSLAELGKSVKLSELRPGDLMFFKGRNLNSTAVGHVALVIEVTDTEIKMIHASSSRGVVIDNFKTSKYYIPRFLKAKRLDYGVE